MRRLRFTFLKFSSTYRLISLLFNEKSRLKSQNLKRSRVRKFWAKLFKKPTKCRNGALHQSGVSKFCRSANQNQVILPSIEGKLRKNALCLNQSAFSNFARYVINVGNNARATIRQENLFLLRHFRRTSSKIFGQTKRYDFLYPNSNLPLKSFHFSRPKRKTFIPYSDREKHTPFGSKFQTKNTYCSE